MSPGFSPKILLTLSPDLNLKFAGLAITAYPNPILGLKLGNTYELLESKSNLYFLNLSLVHSLILAEANAPEPAGITSTIKLFLL